MARVNAGETAVITCAVKTLDHYNNIGAQTDPTSVPILTITDPNGTVVVNAQNMSFSETGLYFYNYAVGSIGPYGRYKTHIVVTDGTLVTIQDDYFTVGR